MCDLFFEGIVIPTLKIHKVELSAYWISILELELEDYPGRTELMNQQHKAPKFNINLIL